MCGSRITSISVWEESTISGKIFVRFDLEDGRSKTKLLSLEAMFSLAHKLQAELDPKTEIFRPFLGGSLGWVWDKVYWKEEMLIPEVPF